LAQLSPATTAAGPSNPVLAGAPAQDPAAPLNGLFDGITAPKNVILCDPALTNSVVERAKGAWKLFPRGERHGVLLRHALEAGDSTGAREALKTAARDARLELGARASSPTASS
jgi:hypothetical protein